jgi:predicted permease
VLLTVATVVLELITAHDERQKGQGGQRPMALTVLTAVKNGVIHPVPLPIIIGLLFAQTGLVLPDVVDRPFQLLGNAFGPVALVLLGVTLTQVQVGPHLRGALSITLIKNLCLPTLMAALGWAWGMSGVPYAVMVVAASLPMGANVFLFAQRYEVAQDLVTASMAVSTVLGLATITLVMSLVGMLS